MRKSYIFLVALFLILCSGYFAEVVAQPPPPPPAPPCGGPFGGPPCPIDGGVSLLIAAGLAYGGKKTYDLSRKN
ncbi:MAG: PID-CTERM protein-sorting domain-containing protein [Flavobacteriales bacterium]